MTFTESNTVEALVRDILCGGVGHHTAVGPGLARRHGTLSGLGWHYLGPQHLPRQAHEILVEYHLREALIRLNSEIAAQPDRADDVLYRLRAILMGVRTAGLVKANEEFAAWLAGERSMPFGADGEHVTVRLVDLEDVERNQYNRQHPVHRPIGRERAPRGSRAAGERAPAGRHRGEDAGTVEPELVRRGNADPRRLRAQRARSVRAEPLLGRYRREGSAIRLDWPAGRSLGTVAGGRRHGHAEARTGQADHLLDAPPEYGSGSTGQLHGLRHEQGEAASQDRRTLPAGRSGRTALSSGSSPATPRRAWSGTSRVPASRS